MRSASPEARARSSTLLQILRGTYWAAPVRRVMARGKPAGRGARAMIAAMSLGPLFQPRLRVREAWVTTDARGFPPSPIRNYVRSTAICFPIYRSVREAMPPVWAALAQSGGEANP